MSLSFDEKKKLLAKLAALNAMLLASDASPFVSLSDISGPPLQPGSVPGAVPHPGQTIAEGAHAAAGVSGEAGGSWSHGFGHNAHVKTPGGEKLFHEPIGALIVAHPHPFHEGGHGNEAAEHAVNAGTHKYVQSGEHSYAVAKDADVHVPKDTDIHDEGAVKNAPKVIVGQHHGVKSTSFIHPGTSAATVTPHTADKQAAMDKDWKKLPYWGPKKPVSVKGKHAGWVPHHWKVYKAAGMAEDKIAGKFAKDEDGNWSHIASGEPKQVSAKNAVQIDKWVAEGKLVEEGAEQPHPELHAVPHVPKEGTEPAKADIGGVHVTHEEIKSAIAHLETAKSTNVKGPLKSKGHPLAAMDYMKVAKEELAKHPELKVPPGTKKEHVGQVKLAVLHHLHAMAAQLAKNDAESVAASAGLHQTEAAAGHAQHLAPAVAEFPKASVPEEKPSAVDELLNAIPEKEAQEKTELPPEENAPQAAPVGVVKSHAQPQSWGGVQVTTEQLQQAAQWLKDTSSGPSAKAGFKAAMKKSGNPMSEADYMGVAAEWKSANPAKAKGLNTKQLMLAHVNELLGSMTKAEEESGHGAAVELHEAITGGVTKPGWEDYGKWGGFGAVTAALRSADSSQKTQFAVFSDGKWSVTGHFPDASGPHYAVHPDHTVFSFMSPGTSHEVPPEQVLEAVKTWSVTGSQAPGAQQVPAGEPPAGSAVPEATASGMAVYPKPGNYDEVHALVVHAPMAQVDKAAGSHSLSPALAYALWSAPAFGMRYVTRAEGGTWHVQESPPLPGSWGAKTASAYFKVTPEHVIVRVEQDGSEHLISEYVVLKTAGQHFSVPANPEPGKTVPVFVSGKEVAQVPEGSKIYALSTADPSSTKKFVKFPDGSWHGYHDQGLIHGVLGSSLAESNVKDGYWKEITGPEAEGKTLFTQDGHEHWAAPGVTAWKDNAYPQEGTYFRTQDGKWQWWASGTPAPEDVASDNGSLQEGVLQGNLVPHGEAAVLYAKLAGAKTSKVVDAPPVTPLGQPVFVKGKAVGQVPADAKVYWSPVPGAHTEEAAHEKPVKYADGTWAVASVDGIEPSASAQTWDTYAAKGFIVPSGQKKPADYPAEKEAGKEPEKPAEPAAIPAVHYASSGHVVVGEFPAGSQLYKNTGNGYDEATYAKSPSGDWYKTGSASVYQTGTNQGYYDSKVESGNFSPVAAPTAGELKSIADAAALKEQLKTGAATVVNGSGTWQQAMAAGLSLGKGADVFVTAKKSSPGFMYVGFLPAENTEYWRVSYGSLTGTHYLADGTSQPITLDEVKQAVADYVQPSSVLVSGGIYKHGFYYKPKGKAYLEIKAGSGAWSHHDGAAGKANYIWHDSKGNAKTVSAVYAASFLSEGGDQYHSLPKAIAQEPDVAKKVSYASTEKPGIYGIWGTNGKPIDSQTAEIHPDGSHTLHAGGTAIPLPAGKAGDDAWNALLGGGENKTGFLLDKYGTSVVSPGIQPDNYVVFGKQFPKDQVQKLLDDMMAAYQADWKAPFNELTGYSGDKEVQQRVKLFLGDKIDGKVTGAGQRDSIIGLLRELLLVPQQPSGTQLGGGVEPSYLKGLPPGINTPKDMFAWTGHGYAKPFSGTLPAVPGNLDSASLTDKIKAISAGFGDGKVVGTHPSALSKAQKAQWLQAWKNGDMKAVFALDAQGGKVSPVHPGAPGNAATHSVTWAPWDETQVPASHAVEGEWTSLDSGVTLPKAEVSNYLIKAGLQHAEYLSHYDRRAWVVAHRSHEQDTVDQLSRQASEKWKLGGPPLTEPPAWSDDIKPAKAYDSYLEGKHAAESWTSNALAAFIADHPAEFLHFQEQVAGEHGYSVASLPEWYNKTVVQLHLDAEKAKQVAEQSVPVWTKTPGAVVPKGSHPIYELTRTVPLTGETSQWLFKPAPDAEKFLAEQETAAGKLANAFGFRTPGSQVLEHDGKYGQAQRKLDAAGDLSFGKPLGFYDVPPIEWGKLTQRQVSDIAREHLLDWVLDNDDSRASNYLRLPDGSVVGIDKGRAWIDLGHWEGLSGNSSADARSLQVSTQLYNAVRSHSIGKDVADKAYIDVIQRARRMQLLSDDRLAKYMEEGLATRPSFGSPGSKQALIKAVAGRKNSLADDFSKLWGQVYKDAGWQLPEVPVARLQSLADGTQLHSGFSEPDFLGHVEANGSHGVPAFFGGHGELHGGNFLVWKEYEGKGTSSPVWWGESTARGNSYEKMIEWAKQHDHTPLAPGTWHISKASGFYSKILAAGKTVSHHAADKKYNSDKMKEFADVVTELKGYQGQAEAAVASGSGQNVLGVPASVALSAVSHYLDLADRIEKAKETEGTFKPGDLPDWTPPPKEAQQVTASPVKVEVAQPYRPASIQHTVDGYKQVFDPEDGQLHVSTSKSANGESSKVWRITLPTGEEIELSDGTDHGVHLAHHGRLRFRTREGDASSFERIRSQLQDMGMNLAEAEQHDLELYYWRHLAEELADRKDRTTGVHGQVWSFLEGKLGDHGIKPSGTTSPSGLASNVQKLADAGLSPAEELAVWHGAWAKASTPERVAEWSEKHGYMPRFSHMSIRNPSQRGGMPHWYRFDISRDKIASWDMFQHEWQNNASNDSMGVLRAGGLLSKEDRYRSLALEVTGLGNPASSGATAYVYTRLHYTNGHVLFSPKALARTTNYAWDTDEYGNSWQKAKLAYFNADTAAGWYGSGNETMVHSALSLLDDIELLRAYNSEQRDQMIKELKAAGISKIRGLPVEDRIVLSFGDGEIKKIRDWYIEHPEQLDTLIEEGLDGELGLTVQVSLHKGTAAEETALAGKAG